MVLALLTPKRTQNNEKKIQEKSEERTRTNPSKLHENGEKGERKMAAAKPPARI